MQIPNFRTGFTFVELLIVISLMAILGASVSAAFLSFEKRQRLTEAASVLKNTVRQAQNNALSGKSQCAATNGGLVGWYVTLTIASNQITMTGLCETLPIASGGPLFTFGTSTVTLPAGVTVAGMAYGSTSISGPAYELFRHLKDGVTFHSATPFINTSDDSLLNLYGTTPQNNFTVTLSSSEGTSNVVMTSAGEVQ